MSDCKEIDRDIPEEEFIAQAFINKAEIAPIEAFPADFKIDDDEKLDESSLFQSPQRRRKNIILESNERSKIHIISTQNNFITVDMSQEKAK